MYNSVTVPAWVVLQSVRYALPRRSYAVGMTIEHLLANWNVLSDEVKTVIMRDIREHVEREERRYELSATRPGGWSEMDVKEWRECLRVLEGVVE